MKTFKKNLKITSPLMAFLILFISCEQYDYELPIDEANYPLSNKLGHKSFAEMTGEDLFQGLFFFGNDLSKQIDIISRSESFYRYENDIEFKTEMDKLNFDIVEQINMVDEYFFENFKSLITSGEHLKVREAYKLASIHIFNALPKLEQFEDYDFERFEHLDIEDYIDEEGNLIENEELAQLFPIEEWGVKSQMSCGIAIVCVLAVLAISYVVAVQVAAVAWVAAVFAAVAFWSGATINIRTQDYEATINEIVEIYAE